MLALEQNVLATAPAAFDSVVASMDLCMDYESYTPADHRSIAKTVSKAPFLVQQMSAAMYDTLAALDQIGLAKQQLSAMLTVESKNSRDMKTRLTAAQDHTREALRFSPVLFTRQELVQAMNFSPPAGIGRRTRENQKGAGKELGVQLLLADKFLKKLVPSIGRDLAMARAPLDA